MKLYKNLKKFTNVSNEILTSDLSLKAIGLYTYLVSKPEAWEYTIEGIASQVKDGRDSVRSSLHELELAGFVTIRQSREGGKFNSNEYMISDRAIKTPFTEKPMTEKPMTENPTQVNTKEVNTKKVKKENIKEKVFWNEYQELHAWFLKKRGGRSKPNKNNLSNYSQWRKTYDLLDMKFAVSLIDYDDYWSKSNITLDIVLRQRGTDQQPIDRIGGFMSIRVKGYAQAESLLSDYMVLRDYFDNGLPTDKSKWTSILLALKTFDFQDEIDELKERVKDGSSQTSLL